MTTSPIRTVRTTGVAKAVLGSATQSAAAAKRAKAQVVRDLTTALAADPGVHDWATGQLAGQYNWMDTTVEAFVASRVQRVLDMWALGGVWPSEAHALHLHARDLLDAGAFTYALADDVQRRYQTYAAEQKDAWGPFGPALLHAVHSATQHVFAAHGPHVTLYRGVPDDGRRHGFNPLSSWSLTWAEAAKFAFDKDRPAWLRAKTGTIYTASVPVERLWSCPVTGPGCLHEHEVIVLGAQALTATTSQTIARDAVPS